MKLVHIAVAGVLGIALVMLTLYLWQQFDNPQMDFDPSVVHGSENHLDYPSVDKFYLLLNNNHPKRQKKALREILQQWQPGNAIMLLESLKWLADTPIESDVEDALANKLRLRGKYDKREAQRRIWSINYHPHPEYIRFKRNLYGRLDPRFGTHFDPNFKTTIRIDEILWGGVQRDGIPPLKNPTMLTASDADYLDDSNVIFGIEINGDVRAYPKRILAWHEMFKDTVGGVSVTGVYCTLCGSLVIYETENQNEKYELGTSGFLYRSNKLMYDDATNSLWSTLKGEPVVGPLVGRGIKLSQRPVVTTTWGQWKKIHPETQVLSLMTGHARDYREGAAYREYFGNDRLMFAVPKQDSRLKNKTEVLTLRNSLTGDTVAIDANFLAKTPVYHDQLGELTFVVLTDSSGASRVYESQGQTFNSFDGTDTVTDESGSNWSLSEANLIGPGGKSLARLPAHRAFWFGWVNVYPETKLVK